MKKKGLIIAGVIVLALLVVATMCTATVQTGYTGIVTTFGKVENMTLEAGLHLKSPFQRNKQKGVMSWNYQNCHWNGWRAWMNA